MSHTTALLAYIATCFEVSKPKSNAKFSIREHTATIVMLITDFKSVISRVKNIKAIVLC